MTGKAREHEVRITGLGLAVLALLAALAMLWIGASISDHLRVPDEAGAAVTQTSSG